MQFKSLRYPTMEQNKVWLRRRQEIAPSQIASEMAVSRPYVSQAQKIAEKRIEKLLLHTAGASRIELRHIDARYGVAVGHCSPLNSKVYITYSPEIGVQLWYSHTGDCSGCHKHSECDALLKSLSREWGLPIPEGLLPTEAGARLFDAIQEVLGWEEQG